eukprot:TRINITY_DN5733_c1_g1_i1.p1 TRINITY_DN5733_c1_g1~~TRINITY_DN5733_c1_g1_i1.p1  ORF type:complete len:125 (-),score=1.61 TRINITY_DN5733_c1_g1_i1:263-637(-)
MERTTGIPRNYPFKTQVKVVNACTMLHNFIMMRNPNSDKLYQCHHRELVNNENNNDDIHVDDVVDGESERKYAYRFRDAIAEEMWSATTNRRYRLLSNINILLFIAEIYFFGNPFGLLVLNNLI